MFTVVGTERPWDPLKGNGDDFLGGAFIFSKCE